MKKIIVFCFLTLCFIALMSTGIAYAIEPDFSGNTSDNRYELNSSNDYTVVFSNSHYYNDRKDSSLYTYYFYSDFIAPNLIDLEVFPRAGENTADTFAQIYGGAHPSGFTGTAICRIKRKKLNGTILIKEDTKHTYNANYEWEADPGSFWPYSVEMSEHEFILRYNDEECAYVIFYNGNV